MVAIREELRAHRENPHAAVDGEVLLLDPAYAPELAPYARVALRRGQQCDCGGSLLE